jgi:general secretion pathway protein C
MAKKKKSKRIARKVPYWVEAFVVKLSLQNPEYGARRLVPLLEQQGITVSPSAVYTILKRNNLQNRTLRLSRLEEERAAANFSELVDTTPPSGEPAHPLSPHDAQITPQPRVPLVAKISSKSRVRSPWSLNPLNILLLGLVGYLWVSALGNLLEARREPLLPHFSPSVAVESEQQVTVRPLEDYSIILERNLFASSWEETVPPQKEVALEGLPVSLKVLGLKLVGTVVGDDAEMRLAIIDNQSTRKQELYREGDQVGEALVKKILRNNVVLNTGRGDEVLTLEPEESRGIPMPSPTQQSMVTEEEQTSTEVEPEASAVDFFVKRHEVEASLADVDQFMEQMQIIPQVGDSQTMGFGLGGIHFQNILAEMGLRNGDVITGVNDEAITGPEQAAEFFQRLKEGGDIEIQLIRRLRPISIRLKIE